MGRDRHGDNLGEFSNGSSLCWSCGYYSSPTNSQKFYEFIQPISDRKAMVVTLPDDVVGSIPPHCLEWLERYGITNAEIVSNQLMYSSYWDQLIFPYFDGLGNLLAWQGRSFREGKSKWWSQGDLKEILHILPFRQKYDKLVLVEDIVSAIKVSRYTPCMPLFGCHTGLQRLERLSRLTPWVTHWLDPDKRGEAVKWSSKASLFGMIGDVIFSEHDPKEETDETIKQLLEK